MENYKQSELKVASYMPKISKRMRAAQLSKKTFLWLALLCTLLQLGLNLPVATANEFIKNNDNYSFALGDTRAEISAVNCDDTQGLVYKRELEEEEKREEKSKSEEENPTESEEELKLNLWLFSAIKARQPLFLFRFLAAKNTKIRAIAMATTMLVPKYILYQQFKYHLGESIF